MDQYLSDLLSPSNNAHLSPTIFARIQQQFRSIVMALNDCIGREETKAYLKCLCSDVHLNLLLAESVRSNSPEEMNLVRDEYRNYLSAKPWILTITGLSPPSRIGLGMRFT